MKLIHANFPTNRGVVYCRLENKVKLFDTLQCFRTFSCPLLAGTIQGEGVECQWEDPDTEDVVDNTLDVTDPRYELLRVENLIKIGKITEAI